MIPELLWIIGFYVAAAACAHRMFRHVTDERSRHYVLVAGNHQLQIEWYIRSLQSFSRSTGADIGITVVLENSSDDTGRIMEIFARGCDKIRLLRTSSPGEPAAAEIAAADQDETTAVEADEARGLARNRVLKEMEAQGMITWPLQIVWVELASREDLERLPLKHCRMIGNRIQ